MCPERNLFLTPENQLLASESLATCRYYVKALGKSGTHGSGSDVGYLKVGLTVNGHEHYPIPISMFRVGEAVFKVDNTPRDYTDSVKCVFSSVAVIIVTDV